MKRLVVCCDSAWSGSDQVTTDSNVSRLAWAIKPVDRNGIAQIIYYQSGGTTEGTSVSRFSGADPVLSLGLSRDLRDAYAFICANYCEGDEIFLFGFSRGAYVARSIGGLIGFSGVVGKPDMDRFPELWRAYKDQDAGALAGFGSRMKHTPIKCIGVWDTVGAAGIAGHSGRFEPFFRKHYGFLDMNLGAHVEHAFHALALDERRKDFVPALWVQTSEGKAKGQELKQVWFAGAHSDVGGGYPQHGAADIPLAWMASEVSPYLDLDLDYLKLRRDLSSKWALGQVHESFTDVWRHLGEEPRTPFAADQTRTFEKVHASVVARMRGGGLGADGDSYVNAAFTDIDFGANVVDLSPLESALTWSDSEVKPGAGAARRAFSYLDRFSFPGWFGDGRSTGGTAGPSDRAERAETEEKIAKQDFEEEVEEEIEKIQGKESPGENPDEFKRLVEFLFATDRLPLSVGDQSDKAFGHERADQLIFGAARINVPDDDHHEIGRLELPAEYRLFGWTLYREKTDPQRHFFVKDVGIISRDKFIAAAKANDQRSALVFVHGFNTTFAEGLLRFGQIVWDMQYKGVPVLFSWPSQGGVLNYLYDKESTLTSRPRFLELLKILQNDAVIETVHILAHSMGNMIVLDALAQNAKQYTQTRLAELILAAPDVPQSAFAPWIASLGTIARGVTLYASSEDKALLASQKVNAFPRAGDVAANGPVVLPGVDSIDVSALGPEMFGLNHNVFASNRSLIDDIGRIVGDGTRPVNKRSPQIYGVPRGADPPRYWRYPRGK